MIKFKISKATLLLSILLLVACNKSEVPLFSDEDGVNFYSTNKDNPKLDDEFEYGVKFNFILSDEIELSVPIFIQGRTAEIDRKVSFIITDSTTVVPEMNIAPTVIKAGESNGVVNIKIKRPVDKTGEFISYVSIDPSNSDFKAGTMERQRIVVKVSDINSYESFNTSSYTWGDASFDYYLGSFSFGKMRFICGIYKLDHFDNWVWDNYVNEDLYRELKAKFNEYKNTPGSNPIYDETKYPEKVWIDFSSDFDNN